MATVRTELLRLVRAHLLPPTRRQVRVCIGVLWLIDAGLQAQPDLFRAQWWRGDFAQSAMGEPASLSHSILWSANVVAAHPALWNSLFVVVEACFGAALLTGRFDRAALVASVPWAFGIWWVGEAFGTLPSGFALLESGSPGPVVLYPLVGLLAWPRRGNAGPPDRVMPRAAFASWAVLWAGQAVLHAPWSLPSGQVLAANTEEYSLGQPAWLLAVAHHVEVMCLAHPVIVSCGLVLAEVTVGLGVLDRRFRRAALSGGIVLSLAFWVLFQYFGTVLGGDATDPGSAPLMIVLAASLWPAHGCDSGRDCGRGRPFQPGALPCVPTQPDARSGQRKRRIVRQAAPR